MTVLSVPYMALLPEMATGYDERTSLNTFALGGAVLGTLAAAGMKASRLRSAAAPKAGERAALIVGVWIALPWLVVFAVSFERPTFARDQHRPLRSIRSCSRHAPYRLLRRILPPAPASRST